jgi:hypothetical protein
MLGWLEWRWLGVFIALNHQFNRWAFAGVRCSQPLRWRRCSAGTPDSPVNYSGAALLKPEGGKFKLVRPWHTGQSGAPDQRALRFLLLLSF